MGKTITLMIDKCGAATNGDMIKALFPSALRSDYIENDMTIIYLQDENESEMIVPDDWWNSPYKECDTDEHN